MSFGKFLEVPGCVLTCPQAIVANWDDWDEGIADWKTSSQCMEVGCPIGMNQSG